MKIKIIYLLVLVPLIFARGAWAGWTTQESKTTQDLSAICFPGDTLGFAVGKSGTIVKNTIGRNTWEAVATSVTVDFNDALFPSENEGYLLGLSGTVLVSLNKGITFFAQPFTGYTTSNFKKGSSLGSIRKLAVSNSSTADSVLLVSGESSGWAISPLTSLEVSGVHLATSEGLSTLTTWIWGKYFSGADSGKNVILKGDTAVWTGTTNINDLFFVNKNIGYAVGDSGNILKTTTGGNTSSAWSTVASGTINNLNAVYFISTLVGWVVGSNGTVLFTADGGDNWASYTLDDPTVNVKDVFVRTVVSASSASVKASTVSIASPKSYALASVLAYLVGTGGKIYKLTSPTITSVTPTSKMQGFLGTFEVTGKGFIKGAYINFYKAGSTTVDSSIGMVSASVESDSKATFTIIIKGNAATGLRDIIVTNPDGTAVKSTNAFTVTASTAKVTFENIWLDLHKYVATPEVTMTVQPLVSCEVTSEAGIPIASSNVRFVTEISTTDSTGSAFILSKVPVTAETQVDPNKIHIFYQIPTHEKLPDYTKGTQVHFILYAEDSAGNVGLAELAVHVADILAPGSNVVKLLPGTIAGIPCYVGTTSNTVDPDVGSTGWFRIPQAFAVSKNFTIRIFDSFGKKVYELVVGKGASSSGIQAFKVKIAESEQGIVEQYSWAIPPSVFTNLPFGMYVMIVTDNSAGKVLAKNSFTLWKK